MLGWQTKHISGLSPSLFAVINNTVRGRIVNRGSTLSSNWSNKFEGTDADSQSPTIAGVLQSGVWADAHPALGALKGKTLVTKAQTLQVWTGLQAQTLDLELEFQAFDNPKLEVEEPIRQLELWASPKLHKTSLETAKVALDAIMASGSMGDTSPSVFGDIPDFVDVDFMGKRYNAVYVIDSIAQQEDTIMVDKNGDRIKMNISLSLKSKEGVTKADIL